MVATGEVTITTGMRAITTGAVTIGTRAIIIGEATITVDGSRLVCWAARSPARPSRRLRTPITTPMPTATLIRHTDTTARIDGIGSVRPVR